MAGLNTDFNLTSKIDTNLPFSESLFFPFFSLIFLCLVKSLVNIKLFPNDHVINSFMISLVLICLVEHNVGRLFAYYEENENIFTTTRLKSYLVSTGLILAFILSIISFVNDSLAYLLPLDIYLSFVVLRLMKKKLSLKVGVLLLTVVSAVLFFSGSSLYLYHLFLKIILTVCFFRLFKFTWYTYYKKYFIRTHKLYYSLFGFCIYFPLAFYFYFNREQVVHFSIMSLVFLMLVGGSFVDYQFTNSLLRLKKLVSSEMSYGSFINNSLDYAGRVQLIFSVYMVLVVLFASYSAVLGMSFVPIVLLSLAVFMYKYNYFFRLSQLFLVSHLILLTLVCVVDMSLFFILYLLLAYVFFVEGFRKFHLYLRGIF